MGSASFLCHACHNPGEDALLPHLFSGVLQGSVKSRLQTLIRPLICYHYLLEDSPSFEQLCLKADSHLFSAILMDKGQLLYALLPPVKTSVYSLRPGPMIASFLPLTA